MYICYERILPLIHIFTIPCVICRNADLSGSTTASRTQVHAGKLQGLSITARFVPCLHTQTDLDGPSGIPLWTAFMCQNHVCLSLARGLSRRSPSSRGSCVTMAPPLFPSLRPWLRSMKCPRLCANCFLPQVTPVTDARVPARLRHQMVL